jgi:hypothetical protein
MRNLILALTVCAFSTGLASATTRSITSQGAAQADTFDLRGSSTTWDYPDTVILDGAVKVISFTEVWNDRRVGYAGGRRYWVFLENDSGPIGYAALTDTAWASPVVIPDNPFLVDTLKYYPDPLPAYAHQLSPANLTGTHVGFQAGTRNYGGEGYPNGFSLDGGRKRVVYFRYVKAGATRYGKLAIRDMKIWTASGPAVADGPRKELERTTMAYSLVDSAGVTFGPSGLSASRSSDVRAPRAGLVWSGKDGIRIRDARGALYNLRGERLSTPPAATSSKP